MASDTEAGNEHTPLLHQSRLSRLQHEQDEEASSIIASTVTKEEQQLAGSTVGERLPYNDYTTIDWLHDLVKDSYRYRSIQSRRGLRYTLLSLFDAASGWIAVVLIGALTACVAFLVDIAVATVSDWKVGYCSGHAFRNREACCAPEKSPLLFSSTGAKKSSILPFHIAAKPGVENCEDWHKWTQDYKSGFAIYVAMALVFGVISSSVTMLTKTSLPTVADIPDSSTKPNGTRKNTPAPKTIYMSSGSGIPELKTLLSGFTLPPFLSLPVLLAKALGAIFAVASGLCLGKEGPFVHISTCTGYQIGSLFPKYSSNGRKMRELLSAACSSGLSVAFGAPIGGVLFSYEEISTFFPRGVMGMAFLCSLTAAAVLKVCNPSGTGKLVLFETNYSAGYGTADYLLFTFLGIVGGVFGGVFCRANFWWSKWFRSFSLIRKNPVLEVGLVVAVTGLLQFPNPLIRDAGDVVIKNLLVDCNTPSSSNKTSYICANEANPTSTYLLTLTLGTLSKLLLTTLTFGLKIPSGVIIPALDAGALFGRLTALLLAPATPPGLFALVSSAAFLAGVTRTTLSLAVIMFELTGQLSHTVPCMLAILVAKLTADAISKEGVYDLAQSVLGHPFLDGEVSLGIVGGRREMRTEVLVPPRETMEGITVVVPVGNTVRFALLKGKLDMLKERGLMDAGLVLVQSRPPSEVHVLQGYISQAELEFGLEKLAPKGVELADVRVRVLGHGGEEVETAVEGLELDLTPFVDRTPLTVCAKAPLEYAVEMFSKLGLRYLCVTEEGTGALVGVVIKKRLVGYLEHLREHGEEDE